MARPTVPPILHALRLPLVLTRGGMLAERLLRCFWPLISLVLLVLALLMLGVQDHVPVEAVWAIGVVAVVGAGAALIYGFRQFNWPARGEALARLDETLPGRPEYRPCLMSRQLDQMTFNPPRFGARIRPEWPRVQQLQEHRHRT